MFHVDIIYLAYRGQKKYAAIHVYNINTTLHKKNLHFHKHTQNATLTMHYTNKTKLTVHHTYHTASAVAQWVRAFAPQVEG